VYFEKKLRRTTYFEFCVRYIENTYDLWKINSGSESDSFRTFRLMWNKIKSNMELRNENRPPMWVDKFEKKDLTVLVHKL